VQSVSRLLEEQGVCVVPGSSSDTNGTSVVTESESEDKGESVEFPEDSISLFKALSEPDGSSKTMSEGLTPLPPLLSMYSTTEDEAGVVVGIDAERICKLHSKTRKRDKTVLIDCIL